MVLVDSSVWILIRSRPGAVREYVVEEQIAICPVIVQELLQGTRSAQHYDKTRAVLMRLVMLDAPVPLERYEQAAELYLRCRDAGITIRNSTDCLIAACALAHDVALLHNDRDFVQMAKVLPLKLLAL